MLTLDKIYHAAFILKDVARKTDGAGGVEELKFSPESARYVRMLGEKRRTKGGYSIFEFEVYSE